MKSIRQALSRKKTLDADSDVESSSSDQASNGYLRGDDGVLSDCDDRASGASTQELPSTHDRSMYEHIDRSTVVGSGTFGTVFKSTVPKTGETVAVKKVLQDPNFKNRELDILVMLRDVRKHVNIIELKHHFYQNEEVNRKTEKYLFLVMGFMPCDLARLIKHYSKTNRIVPICYTKLYMYQLVRGLLYLHSQNVCHRDLKPSNVLFDPGTNQVKICDLGSAKILEKGQPNVSYIASRFYRAPELIFESRFYTESIDMWAFACVMAEMLLGEPLFPGESSVDQLVEIISVIGTPTMTDIRSMNPDHQEFKYRAVKAYALEKVFGTRVPINAVRLLEGLLVFNPSKRPSALSTLQFDFFEELRSSTFVLPSNGNVPSLFNFYPEETMVDEKRVKALIPGRLLT